MRRRNPPSERRLFVTLCLLFAPPILSGQGAWFAGTVGGISTLSADGRSAVTAAGSPVSLYKPENGATAMAFAGRHLSDYVSAQGSYGWNRNRLTLTSTESAAGAFRFYEQQRSASQHSVLGELMLYFRKRESFARPYLSVGAGVVRLESGADTVQETAGDLPAPGGFLSTKPALRVAVGIDVFLKDGWAFRYVFSETLRANAISRQLRPPGQRNLANFQNLFGFVKYF